jgi:hypothetical protein
VQSELKIAPASQPSGQRELELTHIYQNAQQITQQQSL